MKENGFEYVDLGLPSNTMWATCNVGSEKPDDSGLLFQFGRVDGYRYGDENNKFIKNNEATTTSGKVYKANDILDLADDAAHVNMGGKWKMPTYYQLSELFYNTTQEVETINGVKGMMFTSVINGNKLFIPFSGWWHNGSFVYSGSSTLVWSSKVYDYNDDYAYRLYCYSNGYADIYIDKRIYAFPVRGVFNK